MSSAETRHRSMPVCDQRIPLMVWQSLKDALFAAAAEDSKAVNALIRDTLIRDLRKRGVPIGGERAA